MIDRCIIILTVFSCVHVRMPFHIWHSAAIHTLTDRSVDFSAHFDHKNFGVCDGPPSYTFLTFSGELSAVCWALKFKQTT